MSVVTAKKDMEQQNTGKGIELLTVNACNWIKKKEKKWSAKGLWSE